MVIDSGASTNVVDKGLWSELKRQKIACESKKCDKKLYAYGSKEPLKVLGTFLASTNVAESVQVRCSSLYAAVQRSDYVRLQTSV